jgi:hypothetical protein
MVIVIYGPVALFVCLNVALLPHWPSEMQDRNGLGHLIVNDVARGGRVLDVVPIRYTSSDPLQ